VAVAAAVAAEPELVLPRAAALARVAAVAEMPTA
jgi:hypothetical protein